ncbi:hypothetical protein Sjap_021373 [Stephania japonica]|uniref:Uncharacterized protein n=1 Tax=Stephania japonica TaxID=461633 RepID=A0AAP0EMB7_9MAGN
MEVMITQKKVLVIIPVNDHTIRIVHVQVIHVQPCPHSLPRILCSKPSTSLRNTLTSRSPILPQIAIPFVVPPPSHVLPPLRLSVPISLQSWFNDDPATLQVYVAYLSMLPTPPAAGHVPYDTSPSPRHSTEHVFHSLRHLGKDTTPPSNHSAQHRPPLCSDHPVEHGSHSPSSSVPIPPHPSVLLAAHGGRVDLVKERDADRELIREMRQQHGRWEQALMERLGLNFIVDIFFQSSIPQVAPPVAPTHDDLDTVSESGDESEGIEDDYD